MLVMGSSVVETSDGRLVTSLKSHSTNVIPIA